MASNSFALVLFFFLFFHCASYHALASAAVIEDGYAVTTVIDGPKSKINPHAVIFNPGSSDLVVLDSSNSAFYTVPFPVSQDSVIKLIYGGVAGYKDGDSGSVRFNKPRSFAIDTRGNIYVADRNNNVIRKITSSGMTSTIAGMNNKTGRDDGLARNAKFSSDFEIVFVAERCALLVSDHGNQLVRQINLKAEDCKRDSGSGHGKLANSIWGAVAGVALLVGFIVGFAARPYVFTHEGKRINGFNETWKLCLINLGKLVPTLCFATKSAIANFYLVCSLLERLFFITLSHMSLVFRIDYLAAPRVSTEREKLLSLLDSSSENISCSSSEMNIVSDKYANQLKDLMTFDGSSNFSDPIVIDDGSDLDLSNSFGDGRLENMIQTNVMNFSGASVTKETSNLVRRR